MELFLRVVQMREDDFPRRLSVDADGLDAFQKGVARAFEHRCDLTSGHLAIWLRVFVVKSAYRTLIVTVRASRCLRTSQPVACPAISTISARMTSRSTRSSG